jgi:hypothetical protein
VTCTARSTWLASARPAGRAGGGRVPASEAAAAREWVWRLSAAGSTDIHRALLEAAATARSERPTYVIFMTDGNFDSRDDGRPVPGLPRVLDTAYTAYKTYEDRLIVNSTTRSATVDHLSRRFAKTCEAMKADGIEIYTIAFALNNNAEGNATREMFRTCATDRNTHFFEAASGADLNNAFVTIAAELIRLRLAQ